MIDKIIKADALYGLFPSADEITVALSGGADSVALLYALNSLKDEYGFELFAAHYNHGIRGEEADSDEQFVFELCKDLGITCFIEKGNVPLYAKKSGKSIELAARELRYEFLYRVSKGKIATAHTASDNLETVIFNLARGTSLDGIKGIPPVRDRIIRPLILCSREEIEDYCKENNLSFVTDSTNLIDDCSRNIIRHKIVPVLKEINSNCVGNASRLAVSLNEDGEYLRKEAKKEFEKRFDGSRLLLKDFCKLDKAISNRVIVLFCKAVHDFAPDNFHIGKLFEVANGEIPRTGLFDDVCAEKSGDFLVFSKSNITDADFETKTETFGIEEFRKKVKIHELFLNSAIDYDMIVGKLVKVQRNSGDLIKLANSNSTKTIKKLLTEKKVPLNERKNLPLYADDSGIVWGYKIGTADRVKVNENTKTVLYFKTIKIGENK